MAPRTKKNHSDFDEMQQRLESLRQMSEDESKEAILSARAFRKLVIRWLELLTKMVVDLMMKERRRSAEERMVDDEAVMEGTKALVEKAILEGGRSATFLEGRKAVSDNGSLREEVLEEEPAIAAR